MVAVVSVPAAKRFNTVDIRFSSWKNSLVPDSCGCTRIRASCHKSDIVVVHLKHQGIKASAGTLLQRDTYADPAQSSSSASRTALVPEPPDLLDSLSNPAVEETVS